MEPTIPVGSVIYDEVVPVDQIEVGDIITFVPPPEYGVGRPGDPPGRAGSAPPGRSRATPAIGFSRPRATRTRTQTRGRWCSTAGPGPVALTSRTWATSTWRCRSAGSGSSSSRSRPRPDRLHRDHHVAGLGDAGRAERAQAAQEVGGPDGTRGDTGDEGVPPEAPPVGGRAGGGGVARRGPGMAGAAFTAHLETPQTFTASDSFGPPGEVALTARSRNDAGAAAEKMGSACSCSNSGTEAIEARRPDHALLVHHRCTRRWTVGCVPHATFGCDTWASAWCSSPRAGERRPLPRGRLPERAASGPGKSATLDQLRSDRSPLGDLRPARRLQLQRSGHVRRQRHGTVVRPRPVGVGCRARPPPDRRGGQVQYANLDADPHTRTSRCVWWSRTPGPPASHEGTDRPLLVHPDSDAGLLAFCDFAEYRCSKSARRS